MASTFLDLDLILDIRGLQFCLARHLRDFKGKSRWDFYGKSLEEGFRQFDLTLSVQEFREWSLTVKPYLKAKSAVDWLRANDHALSFVSFVEETAVSECLAVLKEQGLDLEPVYFVTRGSLQDFAMEHKEATIVLADTHAVSTLQALGLPAFHVNCPMMQGGPCSFASLEAFFSIIEAKTEDSYSTWQNCIPLRTPNRIEGEVTRGFGRGSSQIGFPTANLKTAYEPDVLPGIYAGTATLHLCSESKTFPAAISVGWNPQFDIDKRAIEAYILHKFTEDLYGMRVTLVLTHYLRAETVFSDLAELKQAIQNDVQLTEELVRAVEVELV
jgi:hypothetical protein